MKKLKMTLYAANIDWSWRFLKIYTNRGNKLLQGSIVKTEENKKKEILKLSEKANKIANHIMKFSSKYYILAKNN